MQFIYNKQRRGTNKAIALLSSKTIEKLRDKTRLKHGLKFYKTRPRLLVSNGTNHMYHK